MLTKDQISALEKAAKITDDEELKGALKTAQKDFDDRTVRNRKRAIKTELYIEKAKAKGINVTEKEVDDRYVEKERRGEFK